MRGYIDIILRLCVIATSAILFSCSNNSTTKNAISQNDVKRDTFPIKELFIDTSTGESWGGDITISIAEIIKTGSSVNYFANSSFGNINVGFELIILDDTSSKKGIHGERMILKSSGVISDNLIKVLSKVYKQKIDTTKHFAVSQQLTFVNLDDFMKDEPGGPADGTPDIKELKIFFNPESDTEEAELFLDINEKEHTIALKEKDFDYRKGVLMGLTEK